MSHGFSEDHLVEQPAVQFIRNELGWDVVNCYGEWDGGTSKLGRDGKREVVLVARLRPALQRLNPDLPVEAIEGAVVEMRILNVGFWILNGRGRRKSPPPSPMLPTLRWVKAESEIDTLPKPGVTGTYPSRESLTLAIRHFS